MEKAIRRRSMEICSLISYVAVILYFLDIILMGTGVLTKIGFFSTRILFFGVAILAAVPLMLQNRKKLIRNPYMIMIVIFYLWLCFAFVYGILQGNPRNIIKTDVFGYLNFAILPVMICVLDSRERIKQLMKIITIATVAVAVLIIVLSFLMFFPDPNAVHEFLNKTGFCAIARMSQNSVRVFFHTGGRYCIVAFLFAFYFYVHDFQSSKCRWLWLGAMMLLLVGVFLSYSRAIYLGGALAVLFVIVLFLVQDYRNNIQKVSRGMLCGLIAAVVLVGGLSVCQRTNLFKVAYYRVAISVDTPENLDGNNGGDNSNGGGNSTIGSNNKFDDYMSVDQETASLDIRSQKITLLKKSISKSWVVGNGLGAAIDFDDGYVEYTYYDIINKMGVIGLCIFLAPFVYMIYSIFLNRKRLKNARDKQLCFIVICSVFYFLFISYFNPSMNTTVGISCYVLCMAVFNFCKQPPKLEREKE